MINTVTLNKYISQVNITIDSYLDEQIKEAPSSEAKRLIRRIKKTTKYGKRFRPALFYLAYVGYGGQEDVVSLGASLELLHQTLLIHDDIMDEDLTRHGKLNIYGLYLKDLNNKAAGLNQALLAGDLLHNFSIDLIASKPDIAKLFNKAFIQTIYGQQLDILNVENKLEGLKLDTLINTAKLKTASYSSILPLKLAAKLTNLKANEKSKLKDFGTCLGVYLQLNNDHQDYFTTNQLNDYQIGKITYPYILGTKLAQSSERKYLVNNFGSSSAIRSKVVDILIKSKALEASLDTLNKYRSKTLMNLDKLNILDVNKQELVALIDRIGV